MKAVARLILTYFTATAWSTWISAVSAAAVLFYMLNLSSVSPGGGAAGFAILIFCASSWRMPQMFDHIARGRTIESLPFGRLKLVASALVTTILVSFIFSIVGLRGTDPSSPVDYAQFLVYFGTATTVLDYMRVPFFWNFFAMVMLWCMWAYAVLWSLAGITTGTTRRMLLLIPLLLLVGVMPMLGVLPTPYTTTGALIAIIGAVWFVFALCIQAQPKLRSLAKGRPFAVLQKGLDFNTRYRPGHELRLSMGLGTKWSHCFAIGVCIVWVASVVVGRGSWCFSLMILAFAAGGMPAYAAAKGRTLWLRQPWSREELFVRIEALYWRYASASIVLLLASFVAIGVNAGLSSQVVAMGIVHGAIISAASIYLGLRQIDNDRRFSDAAIAVGTLLLGILPGGGSDPIAVAAMTILLAALTLRFRFSAKRRWSQLDWRLCTHYELLSRRPNT